MSFAVAEAPDICYTHARNHLLAYTGSFSEIRYHEYLLLRLSNIQTLLHPLMVCLVMRPHARSRVRY
jgi:hypothetical protein